MSEPQDKRQAPRKPAHFVTVIELDGEEIGCGVSRDASGTGFLLLTRLNLAPGRELVLQVFLPREEDPRRLQATVVRCEQIPPASGIVWDYRIAVRLHEPPPDLKDIVQSIVKRGAAKVDRP
jgi:hypothetical protein